MKIQIKNALSGNIIAEYECENILECVFLAVSNNLNLSGADLSGANLSRANLSGADLSGANLSGANLSGADLSRANLSRANLYKANLSGADLYKANLSGADLSGANLSGADLSGANLDKKHRFISISPIGSENGCLWVMENSDGILIYNRGCFSGTKDGFVKAVSKKHAGTIYEKEYIAAVRFIELKLSQRIGSYE
jgi:hypothetical protein